jgi:hypothetical protein
MAKAKPKKQQLILSEKEDIEFKQLILLLVLVIWLAAEHLYFDWSWQAKFRVVRVIYFSFFCTIRIEVPDDPEGLNQYWSFMWKCVKVFFFDLLSMIVLVWIFGRSFL